MLRSSKVELAIYEYVKIIFTLSRPVGQAWTQAFTNQFVQQYMSGLAPANFKISGATAEVLADERLAAHTRDHFERYLNGANSLYKRKVEEAEKKKEERIRAARQEQIAEEEKRQKILRMLGGKA